MKNKILSFILVLMLISTAFVLTGCGNDDISDDEESEVIEETLEDEETEVSKEIELNPELDGTYELAIEGSKIIAVKEDGTLVTIIDEADSNGDCYFSKIEYCAGNLYFAKSYSVQTGSSSTNLDSETKVTTKTFKATNHTFYKVDLTKGDGNYEIELVYDYEVDSDLSVYSFSCGSPIVYNNVLYFIKDMGDIAAYDLATEEETIIHDFKYDSYSTSYEIDKKNAILYYIGESEEGLVGLYSYDIANEKEKCLVEENAYSIDQITDDYIYYTLRDEDMNYSYGIYDLKENISESNSEDLAYKVYDGKKIYFDYGDELGIYSLVIVDENGETTTLLENQSYGTYDGVYIVGDRVQIIMSGELYILDTETLELTKQDTFYRNFVSVDEYSNVNTNVIPEKDTDYITSDEAIDIATSIWGEEEDGNQMIYTYLGWCRDEEGVQYQVINVKWFIEDHSSWLGTIGISFDGKTWRELSDPGYSLHTGDIQRDMLDVNTIE